MIANAKDDGDRDWGFLLEEADKYTLFDGKHDVERVVILPGTNLLTKVDFKDLKALVDGKTKFKPHPITTNWFIRELEIAVGKENLYSRYDSGAKIMASSSAVVVTRSTELGLYARLQGKTVTTFKIDNHGKGSYFGLYEGIERLPQLMGTPQAGVIFNTPDWEAQLIEYLDYHAAQLEIRKVTREQERAAKVKEAK